MTLPKTLKQLPPVKIVVVQICMHNSHSSITQTITSDAIAQLISTYYYDTFIDKGCQKCAKCCEIHN